LDPVTFSSIVSVILLVMAILTARWALIGFKQSKQALKEAASYVSVIVGALSSRIESLEELTGQLRDAIRSLSNDSTALGSSDVALESKFQELQKSLEGLLSQHTQMLQELDHLRSNPVAPVSQSRTPLPEDAVLEKLTPTERQTLQILTEGPLPAPELGRRLNKSREHMARLMKRLYLEGYVDREADRPPFRYKLNDKLRSSLGGPVNASPSEKI
jgi:chromosome segregation ATPase